MGLKKRRLTADLRQDLRNIIHEQQDPMDLSLPKLEDLAIDAVLHLGAALEVLELHARHKVTAINCVCRDLLRIYYAKADQAQSLEPQDKELLGLLHDTAVDLGYAVVFF